MRRLTETAGFRVIPRISRLGFWPWGVSCNAVVFRDTRLERLTSGRFYWSKQHLLSRWLRVYLSSTSAAGVRFLAAIKDGHGLKPSARQAGFGKETGYRWLRESYLVLRRGGRTAAEATMELGFNTSRRLAWEADVERGAVRHHFRVDVEDEDAFWAAFGRGQRADIAAAAAGVSRATEPDAPIVVKCQLGSSVRSSPGSVRSREGRAFVRVRCAGLLWARRRGPLRRQSS